MKELEIKTAEQLSQILRERRKEMGLKQVEMANYTGLSNTGIGRIELGQNEVKIKTLLKMCKILGLKLKVEINE